MKDKIIKRQRTVLQEHGLSSKVGKWVDNVTKVKPSMFKMT